MEKVDRVLVEIRVFNTNFCSQLKNNDRFSIPLHRIRIIDKTLLNFSGQGILQGPSVKYIGVLPKKLLSLQNHDFALQGENFVKFVSCE